MKRTFLRILSYVVVLVGGLAIGFYYASRYNEAHTFAFDAAQITHYTAFMKTQIAQGTDASIEEAIRNFLVVVEDRKDRQSPLLTPKVLATDAALSYARLAALAQKRGAAQEAQQYLIRAASFCPQLGWKECSSEQIVSLVQTLDKKSTSNGAGAE